MSGVKDSVGVSANCENMLIAKGRQNKVEMRVELDESVTAPVAKNETIGKIKFSVEGQEIASFPIKTTEDIEKITFFDIFKRLLLSSVVVR